MSLTIEEAAEKCMVMGFRRGTINPETGLMEWSREDGAYAIIHDTHGRNCEIEIITKEKSVSAGKSGWPNKGFGGGRYSEQERKQIDREIERVNKDTGANKSGGKTDGGNGGKSDRGGYVDPMNH